MQRPEPALRDRSRCMDARMRHAACARPAARAPRAATPLPRRQAWLRIFVVGCSLPCDPPVGGHSCNGGIIARFDRAVRTKGDRQVLWMLPKTANGMVRPCSGPASKGSWARGAKDEEHAMSHKLNS